MFKEISIVAAMLIGVALVNSVSTYSANEIDLVLHVITLDNKPLSNATVIVKPSKVSSLEWVNVTDSRGYAYFYNVETTFYNTVYVEIQYGMYGRICYADKVSVESRNLTLTIPFKDLVVNTTVVNEYLELVNATYSLYYEGEQLVSGEIVNGALLIDESIDKPLLIGSNQIIDTWSYVKTIRYTLMIRGEGFTKNIDVESDLYEQIVIDQYRPVVNIMKTIVKEHELLPYFKWVYLYVSVYDGVFTEKVDLRVESDDVKWVLVNTSRQKSVDGLETIISCWKTSVDLMKYSQEYLEVYINATDPSGKETVLTDIVFLGKIPGKTFEPSMNNTETNASRTPSIIPNSVENTTSSNPDSGGGAEFIPPSMSSSSLPWFDNVYFIGVFISLAIIIYEVKRYRGERDSFG